MLTALKTLASSKKAILGVATTILNALLVKYAHLSVGEAAAITSPLSGAILGQGLADFGKSAK